MKVLKGFTILEILIVLLIISLTVTFALPAWQKTNARMILEKERNKLYIFLREVQARVENSNDIWLLVANRDLSKNRWCLAAQRKIDEICDCLNPMKCSKGSSAKFYYPYFADKTMLISKSYYPKEITRLNGTRNTVSTTCFVLQSDKNQTLFSFFNVGSIKMKDFQSLSACING
ncbi:prepilin-type N-terminal cleavage/methylation domain-containing protein [Canicola haemoglobinophilus]|uniref:Type II secretory pathway, pseudopilin n=1 Tax=Canicola haemoglobinophilus TaxID=733 RepID=A0A1V4B1G8_9PAST|nr:prepilin-type N-terminal cleavage/methylation domain-containing protein [Canicola haemoglobinophilus]OOS00972.1 prepilin-type N-terminal cleavage/methylation domain-containing protein [Canicola haemoglobinophilus]STO54879.1 type II secretory pathway, pseudopilin [Canicola haemoglobinophilus]STO59149.1 type II secretory pathway, pseudopilin [Canicola haemoglobinophilus]STO69550.1 type II secretory pathway, pseudopilin [Canicola haemoglobinophilus]